MADQEAETPLGSGLLDGTTPGREVARVQTDAHPAVKEGSTVSGLLAQTKSLITFVIISTHA